MSRPLNMYELLIAPTTPELVTLEGMMRVLESIEYLDIDVQRQFPEQLCRLSAGVGHKTWDNGWITDAMWVNRVTPTNVARAVQMAILVVDAKAYDERKKQRERREALGERFKSDRGVGEIEELPL